MENKKNEAEKYSQLFLVVLLVGILYLCYLFLKPFLSEIIISAILVTIFYPLYFKIGIWLKGRMSFAAFLTCLLIILIVVIPLANLVYLIAQESIETYGLINSQFSNGAFEELLDTSVRKYVPIVEDFGFDVKALVVDAAGLVRDVFVSGAAVIAKGTTQVITSLLIIVFTMFFMFRDGHIFLKKLMILTPLSNKYDRLIWSKFRNVSYSVIVSTFVTAIIQGIAGGIGFLIIGLPVILPAVLMAFLSLIPYAGAAILWIPVVIYLLITGSVAKAIFLAIWGIVVVGLIDNLIRPFLMRGKAEVHPLIIFFSIIGGLVIMGFFGMIFGPLVFALAFTILHIYELEYEHILEGRNIKV